MKSYNAKPKTIGSVNLGDLNNLRNKPKTAEKLNLFIKQLVETLGKNEAFKFLNNNQDFKGMLKNIRRGHSLSPQIIDDLIIKKEGLKIGDSVIGVNGKIAEIENKVNRLGNRNVIKVRIDTKLGWIVIDIEKKEPIKVEFDGEKFYITMVGREFETTKGTKGVSVEAGYNEGLSRVPAEFPWESVFREIDPETLKHLEE